METALKKELIEFCRDIIPEAECTFMDPKEAVFEENVKMKCFYCKKYDRNWRCPPNIPEFDYRKIFSEFDEGLFVAVKIDSTDKLKFEIIRKDTNLMLHKMLLDLEKWLRVHNGGIVISYGADWCNLCKTGCGKEQCNNPSMSRSALESTGINISKTTEKYGINTRFPVDGKITVVGLVLWQDLTNIMNT